ncbi:MAG: hypothetical protein QFB87_03885 [Patescibacteria group bacterium]|nr:hypothetical protein [Patescibacteria group bacterium]
MASDRKQYEQALRKWDSLQQAECFSVPDEIGRLAVIYSCHDFSHDETDIDTFQAEACHIQTLVEARGKATDVLAAATGNVLSDVIANPAYSSVITIGHGALSYLYVTNGKWKDNAGDRYDWRDVSLASTHLKTGVFMQRQCGNVTRRFSAPLGMFAMRSHAQVLAPSGCNFEPYGLSDVQNNLVVPVTHRSRLGYDDIKAAFSYEEFLTSRTDPCPPLLSW